MLRIALLVVSLSPSLGCAGILPPRVWVEEGEVIEVSAEHVQTLLAKTQNGQVRVRPREDDAETIEVTVTKRVGGPDEALAYEALDAIEIDTPLDEEERVQELTWHWRDDREYPYSVEVSFDVRAPARLAVTARTQNGAIDVGGVTGSCDLESSNGKVAVENLSAMPANPPEIKAVTSNGAVQASVIASELFARSHNGEIVVKTSAERLKIENHNGAIEAELSHAGPIDGSISTHNGSIKLVLGVDVDAEIKGRSSHGEIQLKGLDEPRRKGGAFEGRVGSGGGEIKLETHNGSIRVRVGDDEGGDGDAEAVAEPREEVRSTPARLGLTS